MQRLHIPHLVAGLALAFLGAFASAQDEEAAPLTDAQIAADLRLPYIKFAELDAWRTFVRPTEDESSYTSVDWIPTFAEGLRASAEQGKPLLFWAMNGHPLGCT